MKRKVERLIVKRRVQKQAKVDNVYYVYYVWYLNGKTIRIQSHTPLTVATLRRHIENETGIPEHNQWLFLLTPLNKDGTHPREDDGEPGELTDKAMVLFNGGPIVMVVMPTSWQKYPRDLVTVSDDNHLATQKTDGQWSLVTLDERHTNGIHYWELLVGGCLHVGVFGANTDLRVFSVYAATTWCIFTFDGSLVGGGIFRGASRAFTQGECNSKGFHPGYKSGDRIGILLNLDDGSLLFFKNGVKHGPGFPAGSVKGRVTVGAQMCWTDTEVRIVQNPKWPLGYTHTLT